LSRRNDGRHNARHQIEGPQNDEQISRQIEGMAQFSVNRKVIEAMLKIVRSANGKVVFILSGRIAAEDVAELQRLFASESKDHHLALDLKDVTLVDPDAVKSLSRWEDEGIEFQNCPPYVREWIERERCRSTGRKGGRIN
jgi:hypothetical protein